MNADGKSYLSEHVSVDDVRNPRESWSVEEEKEKIGELHFE